MAEITFPYAPGFADVPESVLAAEQYAMGVHLGRINENAAMGMVRPEVFVTKQIHGDTVPLPISPVDGYQYSRNELIYMWGIHNLVNPSTGVVSDDWLNFWFGQWFVNQDSGLVTIEKWEARNDGAHQTKTNDGQLFVYTIAQRRKTSMYLSSTPYYTEHPDTDLASDLAYHETPLKDLNRNAKYSIVNTEAIYCGTYKSLQKVAAPVSPVDGYQYDTSEITWLWSWVWTTDGDAYEPPPLKWWVFGMLSQIDRMDAHVDADGTVHTNIRYRQDSQIDMGDSFGRIAVTALCQRGAKKEIVYTGSVTGHVSLTHGANLSYWQFYTAWRNWTPASLPSDAVIKGIYLCVIGSTGSEWDFKSVTYSVGGYLPLHIGPPYPTTLIDAYDPPGQYNSENLAISLADSDSIGVGARIMSSGGGVLTDAWVDVTAVGIAVVYDSATKTTEPGASGLVAPAEATGYGVAWRYPQVVESGVNTTSPDATNGTATGTVQTETTEIIRLEDLGIADGSLFSFIDSADLAAGNPVRTDLMVQLNKNIREAVCRPEIFYPGEFTNGQTVPLPVSPIDGYHYSRSELIYMFEMQDTGTNAGGMIRVLSWDASIDPATGLVSITMMHRRDGGRIAYDNEGSLTVKVFAIRGAVPYTPPASSSNTDSTNNDGSGSSTVSNGGMDNFSGSGQAIADGWWAIDTAGDFSFSEQPGITPVGSSQGITIGTSGAGNTAGMRNARSAIFSGDHYLFLFRALSSVAITTGFKARLRFWNSDATQSVYADIYSGGLGTSVLNSAVEVITPKQGDVSLDTSAGVIAFSAAPAWAPAWVDLEFGVYAPNASCTVSIDDVDWYRFVQRQSDWGEADVSLSDFVNNKPAIPTQYTPKLTYSFPAGTATVGVNIGPEFAATQAGEFTKSKVTIKQADAGSDLSFSIRKNGVTVFTATVAHGYAGTNPIASSFAAIPYVENDIFTIDVSAGGAGWAFSVQLAA